MKQRAGDSATTRLRCKAILLDNDGVLVDSSGSIKAAFVRWADSYGLNGSTIYDELHGHRAIEVASKVLPPGEVADGAARLDRFELDDAPNVRALPGTTALLDALRGRWTLVSSGPRKLVEARLRAAGLPSPQFLVSADSVKNGKPHPESYELAAQLNGVPASDCLAFEDSATGLTAADAAGCVTVQVGDTTEPRPGLHHVADLTAVSVREVRDGFEVLLGATQ